MKIPFRPITRIKDMLESMGQQMAYAYEDLVFPEHTAFLLQMGEEGRDLFVHFNCESLEAERPTLLQQLKNAGAKQSLKVRVKGLYQLTPSENDEIRIKFLPLE